MRYYIDTNILAYLFDENMDELSPETKRLIEDYGTLLYTSTVCVKEFIHLCQTGKIGNSRKNRRLSPDEWFAALYDMGVRIAPVNEYHLRQYAGLPFHGDHSDPDDRLIIAQAISDRIPLVSSDRKFHLYEEDGLELVFNKR